MMFKKCAVCHFDMGYHRMNADKPRFWIGRIRLAACMVSGSILVGFAWLIGSTWLLVRSASPRLNLILTQYVSQPPRRASIFASNAMVDAVVASEDGNFYRHSGVDNAALWHAFCVDCRACRFVLGGSTITMQAVRNNVLTDEKTLSRKCAEIVLAHSLERQLPKSGILRLYLSNVYFGLHAADLATAAHIYFNKRPQNLDISESAFLAGILSCPPRRREDVTADFAWRRREQTLQRMRCYFPAKYTEDIIETARSKPLVFAWQPTGKKKESKAWITP